MKKHDLLKTFEVTTPLLLRSRYALECIYVWKRNYFQKKKNNHHKPSFHKNPGRRTFCGYLFRFNPGTIKLVFTVENRVDYENGSFFSLSTSIWWKLDCPYIYFHMRRFYNIHNYFSHTIYFLRREKLVSKKSYLHRYTDPIVIGMVVIEKSANLHQWSE